MKVLLLTTHLEIGGISVYVTSLARRLKDTGHIPVVASSGGTLENRLSEKGIPHHRIPCRTSSELNPKLWLLALPRLLGLIRKERPDLIHAHTRVTQVLALVLTYLTGIPYVSTCHGLYRFRIGRRLFRCWGKWIMAISKPTMERLVEDYRLAPPHRVVLVRNGIEVGHFLPAPSPEEVARFRQALGLKGSPIVGAIARLSPIKGLDSLLKAVPGLLPDFPNLQILLVGAGPERDALIRLAYSLRIQEHVVISHSVKETRIPLAAMEVFVDPALREGFGLGIVEAMVAGVPVVVTNNGGPKEIIEDGRSGLLITPGSPEPLARAIRVLLSDPGLRRQMAENARQRALNLFNMDRVVKEVEAVYLRAISGRAESVK